MDYAYIKEVSSELKLELDPTVSQVLHCFSTVVYCWAHDGQLRSKIIKINATEAEILAFLFHTLFFLVKAWSLHYPECNLAIDSLVKDANEASRSLPWREMKSYRGVVTSLLSDFTPTVCFLNFQTCSV